MFADAALAAAPAAAFGVPAVAMPAFGVPAVAVPAVAGWPSSSAPVLVPEREATVAPESDTSAEPDLPWQTVVWNDPVNLMSYVTHVLMTVFGYPKVKATKLMLDVHHKGKAIVSSGPRERMEGDTATLQGYGLWATIQRQSRWRRYGTVMTP